MEQRIAQLEAELAKIKEEYYRENYPTLEVKRKDLALYGKIGFFSTPPVSQGASVTTVGTPSGGYVQAEAQAAATAINALIARLQAYGLLP